MNKYYRTLIKKLEAEGLSYSFDDDTSFLNLAGENYRNYIAVIYIKDDGDNMPLVTIGTENIASFKGKESKGYALCNELNKTTNSGMVKFIIEEDMELSAYFFTYFSEDYFYEHSYSFLNTFYSIIDETYPMIMRALYA